MELGIPKTFPADPLKRGMFLGGLRILGIRKSALRRGKPESAILQPGYKIRMGFDFHVLWDTQTWRESNIFMMPCNFTKDTSAAAWNRDTACPEAVDLAECDTDDPVS
ncbi:hypothetical protein NDU88_007407 [Pleurodeles waltl]|uniref:Uncharacterized protein n=1 Tax=Pleurodeles waltl TaxID=8319 RepID=A0AAV7SSB3_PLEWA|nr:hypothetical protein NDU88_007407 [Pleurodeles waltl]